MVQYEGHLTKEGDLIVNVDGSLVSLHEFLRVARLGGRHRRRRESGEGRATRRRALVAGK